MRRVAYLPDDGYDPFTGRGSTGASATERVPLTGAPESGVTVTLGGVTKVFPDQKSADAYRKAAAAAGIVK
jgi:hypothetical protein